MTERDHPLLSDYQRRTRELEALYETAGDLSALRDVDQVLAAIVRRSRQLLASDVAYLMLLDDAHHQAYMRTGEGIQTPAFFDIRLTYGEGLGGLVAATGMPQWTSDYFHDDRFAPSIDSIVRDEALRAILGVPLTVGQQVTGVLFAADRRRRDYTHDEVALLSSLASHAAIALENASLFEASERALRKWREANARIEQHNQMLERAAELHETLTSLVLTGASLPDVADAVSEGIGGRVMVLDADGAPLTPGEVPSVLAAEHRHRVVAGNHGSLEVEAPEGATLRLAPAQAGSRLLGFLLHLGEALPEPDVRTFERAALVTAVLLLDRRAHDDARAQAMAELLTDLGGDGDEAAHRQRAEQAGVTIPAPPFASLVALAGRHGSHPAARLEAAVRLALDDGMLVRVQGREALLVMHAADAGEAAREVAHRLTVLHGGAVTVGAAGPAASLTDAAAALGRARTCAQVLENTGKTGSGATPEELGVYTLLFSEVGRDRIEAFIAETIGTVREHDDARDGQLLPTLKAYYDVGGHAGRLSEALFVHVNTVYQRLDRIDALLGEDWRRGERSLQVHLAVRLMVLLDETVWTL